MRLNLVNFKKYNWTLIVLVGVLCAFSFAAIYSIDLSRGEKLVFFPTQLAAFVIGLVLLFLSARFDASFFQAMTKPIYLLSIILLVLVLWLGESVRGTVGWFRFGGLSFQPAEFAKLGLILMMGFLIFKQGRRFDKLQFVVLSGIFLILPVALILLQPDLGSALVLGGTWFGMLILTGVKRRYLLGLLALLVLGFFISWHYLLVDYQKDRFLVFLHPEKEALTAGYNINQSIIAIGAGRFLGRGLGFGSQSQLHFLPEAQTDFIFSVIAEELGFIGASIVLALYLILLFQICQVARRSKDEFGSYVALGVGLLFFIQITFNLGAATGLLPITGLTLPFVSYGGSSLVVNLLLIGIVQSVHKANWVNEKEGGLYG